MNRLLSFTCPVGRGLVLLVLFATTAQSQVTGPPKGFTALFDGKDLSGWRGGDTFDHRKWLALTEGERAAKASEWTGDMRNHWRVENGELINDGLGKYATTEKEYGDFELLVEYKTVPKADSGIYLRGVPQVQIWDHIERKEGSGGLWNNSPDAPGKTPLVLADKPFGEWNKFRIVMVGSRVSVWLNNKLVVDHAILENYYDRKTPVPARGPIELQTHGNEIRWRNIFLREISAAEANELLRSRDKAGFQSMFNGKDFTGWGGSLSSYEIKEGAIACRPGEGGTIFTKEEFGDFAVRFEFNLPPGGNNGLAIRYPGTGDPAYFGMSELQILDDDAAKYKELDPRQYHGSAYGMVPAQRGYLRPPGEWNYQEVTVKGSTILVELNGTKILDTDLSKVSDFKDGTAHPGKDRTSGHFGFAGHNDPVRFRRIEIKKL